jgi:hypothetical protein
MWIETLLNGCSRQRSGATRLFPFGGGPRYFVWSPPAVHVRWYREGLQIREGGIAESVDGQLLLFLLERCLSKVRLYFGDG